MKRKTKRKQTKKKKRISIKNAKMISKKNYKKLLKKKKSKKRLSKKDKEKLNRALFVNYCKCIKKLKYSKKYEIGFEYPICMSSIYKKRGLKPPKDVKKKCKNSMRCCI